MNSVYKRYEHLRKLCANCHEEEYGEYLHDYPFNPFENEKMKLEVLNISINIIDEAIQSGSCDDLFEALYLVPKLKECLYGN